MPMKSIYGTINDMRQCGELLGRIPRFNKAFVERPGFIDHVKDEDALAVKELLPNTHIEDCCCCIRY